MGVLKTEITVASGINKYKERHILAPDPIIDLGAVKSDLQWTMYWSL